MGTFVSVVSLVLEGILGLFMAYSTYLNFSTAPLLVKRWNESGMPRWYTRFAGVLGAIGALALLVGVFVPIVGVLAMLWMMAYFIVATLTHLVVRDPFATTRIPLFFLALCVMGAILRWPDLSPVLTALRLG